MDEEYSITQIAHGWTEFYLPEYGWVPIDPTFGRNHKFDYFAKSYASHVVLTKGADIHFLTRGTFTKPYGETDIKTEYVVKVNSIDIKNLSYKRAFLKNFIFIGPALFVLFLLFKRMKQRKGTAE